MTVSAGPVEPLAKPVFILDVGGVLVRHDNGLLYDRLAARCADPFAARQKLVDAVHDEIIGTGHLSVFELHARLVFDYDFSATYEAFLGIWSSHFSEEPDMEPVVRALARRHRVVLFSNTNAAHWAHVTAYYPTLAHSHHAYLSYELGLIKPDPASFRRVLELEDCRPDEVVFVDDRADNVAAAQALGMDAITFTAAAPFRAALADRGITLDL
ncbi:MAG TPA: HAD-IA family hydrolase [Aliidongia sp.]|uniref:HAD-IA family hydrolase n=1 Tax=Aliidongia sp. TaxID=1914230 RepID=UPI002DDD6E07|nr:HAD-IA family hydrolase [Aliidongia sp.]HEV2678069.1 HAD-IA family hydrolase [Aliidongia sp.]